LPAADKQDQEIVAGILHHAKPHSGINDGLLILVHFLYISCNVSNLLLDF